MSDQRGSGIWRRAGQRIVSGATRLALAGLFGGLRLAGPVASSNLGGAVARAIGPRLAVSRVADRNLMLAMPELDAAQRVRIVRGVWDSLGRTVCELPHLPGFARTESGPGWEVEGEEHLRALQGGQALFFSGHIGNWEIILPIARRLGVPVSGVYRAASNRAVDRAITAIRLQAMGPGTEMFAKGAAGARRSLAHLHRGGSLGMLVDQKMNDGVAVPFFGREAMTAPALAQLALRFDIPIVPAHVRRIGPARFRLVCEPPIRVARGNGREADILALCRVVNEVLERWIREDPAAWLWLHRRWPKPAA